MSREQLLTSIRELTAEKPTTKMGQIRWVWPEIRTALEAGHTLRRVQQRLEEIGIGIGYKTLSMYIGRLERQQGMGQAFSIAAEKQSRKGELSESACPSGLTAVEVTPRTTPDPFANIRRERDKKRVASFEYDAFSTNKNLRE